MSCARQKCCGGGIERVRTLGRCGEFVHRSGRSQRLLRTVWLVLPACQDGPQHPCLIPPQGPLVMGKYYLILFSHYGCCGSVRAARLTSISLANSQEVKGPPYYARLIKRITSMHSFLLTSRRCKRRILAVISLALALWLVLKRSWSRLIIIHAIPEFQALFTPVSASKQPIPSEI